MKYQLRFVAALKDAKLLRTNVSDTAKGLVSLSQAPLQMKW
jgi:hypothetical protein